jgi:ribosomal protein L37E
MSMVHCRGCGKQIHESAPTCPHCGAPQAAVQSAHSAAASDKKKISAALLCWFLGVFGAHRFYVGKVGTGLIQLFTLGGLGIWAFIDLVMILLGKFEDKSGRLILN